MTDRVQCVLRVGRNTSDLGRAVAFYRDALGFHVEDPPHDTPPGWTGPPGAAGLRPRGARLLLGAQQIDLRESPEGTRYPAGSSSCDLWFQHCAIVTSDIEAVCQRVIEHGATPISRGGPQTLPPAAGSVTAFKFRDPDGHPLELIEFPRGTGDPAWQGEPPDPGCPTLGIDHSAISVADVERSIAFYARLGLTVATRGVNRGREQQRLDGLADVDVDVVALRPIGARTPHVELLGYRRPRGRQLPATSLRDIVADHLMLHLQHRAAATTRPSGTRMKVAGQAAAGTTGGGPTAVLQDPDGHWLVVG